VRNQVVLVTGLECGILGLLSGDGYDFFGPTIQGHILQMKGEYLLFSKVLEIFMWSSGIFH
jgi:hypothetical protein